MVWDIQLPVSTDGTGDIATVTDKTPRAFGAHLARIAVAAALDDTDSRAAALSPNELANLEGTVETYLMRLSVVDGQPQVRVTEVDRDQLTIAVQLTVDGSAIETTTEYTV